MVEGHHDKIGQRDSCTVHITYLPNQVSITCRHSDYNIESYDVTIFSVAMMAQVDFARARALVRQAAAIGHWPYVRHGALVARAP